MVILTVLIGAALVNRKWAAPIIALTWIVPAVVVGAGDEEIAKAICLAPLAAYAGVYGREWLDRRFAAKHLTARA